MKNLITTLPRHQTRRYKDRDVFQIKGIAIHHTAVDSFNIESYARFHVNERGWPGIAYHIMIGQGQVFLTNYLTTKSYHVRGNNTEWIGLCFMGNYTNRELSEVDINTAREAISWCEWAVGRKLEIKRHGDIVGTTCPGKINIKELGA